jgi:hypothetical protein
MDVPTSPKPLPTDTWEYASPPRLQVHFHIVPAPKLSQLSYTQPKSGWASTFSRDELDDDEAAELVARIRREIEQEEEERQRVGTAKL